MASCRPSIVSNETDVGSECMTSHPPPISNSRQDYSTDSPHLPFDKRSGLFSPDTREFVHPNPSGTIAESSNSDIRTSLHGQSATSPLHIDGGAPPWRMESSHVEPPEFGHYRLFLSALLLTTILAIGSAVDAKIQCLSHEVYYLLELFDDDSLDATAMVALAQQSSDCVTMFRYVMLPVGGSTVLLGSIALFFINYHVNNFAEMPENLPKSHFGAGLKLLALLLPMQVVWTYGIFAIMLWPKIHSAESGENPYNSLAALTKLGYVGDNANLYYLSWISETLITALLYDCFRWFRAGFSHHERSKREESYTSQHERPKREESYTSQCDLNQSVEIPRDDNLQTILTYASARHLESLCRLHHKTWYEFMLRLRVRSGCWFAAFCSTLIVVASSTYFFKAVLTARALQIVGEDASHLRYRDVCALLVADKGGDLPDQLCIRTFASVVSGAIAVLMCAVTFILHLLVRRKAVIDLNQSCNVFAWDVIRYATSPGHTRIPLWCEFLLSFSLSILLGLNSVFVTGVQGPASTVGNLYYASWLAFLLCLRISLGCLEELYDIETNANSGVCKVDNQSDASSIPPTQTTVNAPQKNRAFALTLLKETRLKMNGLVACGSTSFCPYFRPFVQRQHGTRLAIKTPN